MKVVSPSKVVLITGGGGFTGIHLTQHLKESGFEVHQLESDLVNREAVFSEVVHLDIGFVVHLAAMSFAAESNITEIYKVNIKGSLNLLDSLVAKKDRPKKVIMASSATVYGNQEETILSEDLCPQPVSHYGCSKLSMEHLSRSYQKYFPITFLRPFNYTGVGHGEQFLIPKIVAAYKAGDRNIELGNLDVSREFNDVRDVCQIYEQFISSSIEGETCNVCSGKAISLMDIISLMNNIAGYEMNVSVNPDFVRDNEIKSLSGDIGKLKSFLNYEFNYDIKDTLRWMYEMKA